MAPAAPISGLRSSRTRAVSAEAPRRAYHEASRWWRRGLAAAAVGVTVITTFVTFSAPSADVAHALQAQIAPASFDQARQQRVSRSGAERVTPTIGDLVAQRNEMLSRDNDRIEERQQQAALAAREDQLADTAESVKEEAERLRNLSNFYWPTEGGVSSGFGYRIHPILRIRRLHNGADIGGDCGQPIWAAQSGTVTNAPRTGYNGGTGRNVRIDHGDIDGTDIQTAYLHMSEIEVKVGQKVNKGDRIGTVGTTGLSTGCHLHFSLYKNGRASDPLEYAKK